MTISSSSSLTSLYSNSKQTSSSSLEYDKNLASTANYPVSSQDTLKSNQPASSNATGTSNADLAAQSNFVEQFAYAPNVSAMFNAYLEKQQLHNSLGSKKDEIAQRLTDNGTDKKLALAYAQNSVDVYKQILEAQLNSKIDEQVQQQKEFKQKQLAANVSNPYTQMTGTLINLYS